MKKIIIIIFLLLTHIYGQVNPTFHDLNDDGEMNVADVELLVSCVLERLLVENGDIN